MKVLIADDHPMIVDDLKDETEKLLPNAECICTSNPAEIVRLFEQHLCEIVLLDIEIGNKNGIAIARKLLEIKPRTNIIYITGHPHYALESYSTNASAFLVKPVTTERLREAYGHLRFPVSRLSAEALEAHYSGEPLIGKRIEYFREKRGFTRQELAQELNVTLRTIYRWESGERLPDVVTLVKLCQVLAVDLNELTKYAVDAQPTDETE